LTDANRTRGARENQEATMSVTEQPKVDIHASSLAGARAWFSHKGLSRPGRGRVLGGVCASFARRYDVNPLVARLVGIVVIVVLTPLVYAGAWILMPKDAPVVQSAPAG
jgi:phage shock protein PspC (stress-responsive transcriptional regulator)